MTSLYNRDNIFAKIIRGDVPCKKIHEDEYAIAFEDIHPEAPQHILVIPKGEYTSFHDFAAHASKDMVHGFFASVQKVAEKLGLEAGGYRLITNHGSDASQSVHHFHVHLLGGKPLGKLLP